MSAWEISLVDIHSRHISRAKLDTFPTYPLTGSGYHHIHHPHKALASCWRVHRAFSRFLPKPQPFPHERSVRTKILLARTALAATSSLYKLVPHFPALSGILLARNQIFRRISRRKLSKTTPHLPTFLSPTTPATPTGTHQQWRISTNPVANQPENAAFAITRNWRPYYNSSRELEYTVTFTHIYKYRNHHATYCSQT